MLTLALINLKGKSPVDQPSPFALVLQISMNTFWFGTEGQHCIGSEFCREVRGIPRHFLRVISPAQTVIPQNAGSPVNFWKDPSWHGCCKEGGKAEKPMSGEWDMGLKGSSSAAAVVLTRTTAVQSAAGETRARLGAKVAAVTPTTRATRDR